MEFPHIRDKFSTLNCLQYICCSALWDAFHQLLLGNYNFDLSQHWFIKGTVCESFDLLAVLFVKVDEKQNNVLICLSMLKNKLACRLTLEWGRRSLIFDGEPWGL